MKQRPPSDGADGGYVTDWGSCAPFDTLTGADNAAPYEIVDHGALARASLPSPPGLR